MGPCLRLSRVVAVVGGLGLVAAFFMPWFASQGLLLSGQFLHTFLSSATPAEIQRFVPGSSPAEVQALRVLVDLFPVCGGLAAVLALVGAVVSGRMRGILDGLVALLGVLALVAWAGGVTRLPPGARWEVGLWLIATAAGAVLLGATLELLGGRHARVPSPEADVMPT